MGFLRFYGNLLKRTPATFRGAWELVFWLAGVTIMLITALNEPLGKAITTTWQGYSPWWTLGVVLLFAVVRMAFNNYEAFRDLQARVTSSEELTAFTAGIGRLIVKGKRLQNRYEAGEIPNRGSANWEAECVTLLEGYPQHHGVSMAARFQAAKDLSDVTGPPIDPTTITYASIPGNANRLWRRVEARIELLIQFISELTQRVR